MIKSCNIKANNVQGKSSISKDDAKGSFIQGELDYSIFLLSKIDNERFFKSLQDGPPQK